jgi:ATP-dependent helicase/nuclease subunit B
VLSGALPQPGQQGWSSVHTRRLLALYDEVADEFEHTGRTGRAAHWRLDRRSVQEELLTWFDRDGLQVAATGAQILSSELRFGSDGTITLPLPGDRRLSVRGSVDRIDRRNTGELVVMDHKTGRDDDFKQIDAADPTEGSTKFQLPTYAAAALALFGSATTPSRVHAEYDFFERGGYRRHGYSFDETVWERVADDLGHLVSGIESGLFPATPEIPQWEFRISCHYCQPDGLGVAERFGEWQLKQDDPRFAAWLPNHERADSHERQP